MAAAPPALSCPRCALPARRCAIANPDCPAPAPATGRYGWLLPAGAAGQGRGSRSFAHAAKSSALVHDASYLCPLLLHGTWPFVHAALAPLLPPGQAAALAEAWAEAASSGGPGCSGWEQGVWLHHPGRYPRGAICPAQPTRCITHIHPRCAVLAVAFWRGYACCAVLRFQLAAAPGQARCSHLIFPHHTYPCALARRCCRLVARPAIWLGSALLAGSSLRRLQARRAARVALAERAAAAALLPLGLPRYRSVRSAHAAAGAGATGGRSAEASRQADAGGAGAAAALAAATASSPDEAAAAAASSGAIGR